MIRGRLGRLLRPQVPTAPIDVARYGGETQVPRGLGPARIEPSQPDALTAEQRVIGLPAFNYPPDGAIPVDRDGDAHIAPGVQGTILLTIVVPDILRFRMAGIGFGTDDPAALGFLTWAIQVNGVAAPDYFGQTSAVGSIQRLTDIVLFAGNSAVVTVVANIDLTAVKTYRYIARARGWFYSGREEGR